MNPHPRFFAWSIFRNVRTFVVASLITVAIPAVLFAQATKVASTTGHYSAIFPAPAEQNVEPPKTENGLTYSIETYRATLDDQMFVTVSTNYTGATVNTQKELQANVDNFVNGIKAKLISNKPTTYSTPWSSIAGLEFSAETDALTFQGRFFVQGNDVWGILYGARKEAVSEAMKDQFFRSLEINAARPKGEHGPE
jgi:hypothetical protein